MACPTSLRLKYHCLFIRAPINISIFLGINRHHSLLGYVPTWNQCLSFLTTTYSLKEITLTISISWKMVSVVLFSQSTTTLSILIWDRASTLELLTLSHAVWMRGTTTSRISCCANNSCKDNSQSGVSRNVKFSRWTFRHLRKWR